MSVASYRFVIKCKLQLMILFVHLKHGVDVINVHDGSVLCSMHDFNEYALTV
jgi:hypothetical protein